MSAEHKPILSKEGAGGGRPPEPLSAERAGGEGRANYTDELDDESPGASPDDVSTNSVALAKLVLVSAATAATLGYDVGIMAAAIQPLEATFGLTSIQKEVAMGSLNFVAALGALLGGQVANEYGRKPTVQLCGWIFVLGTCCMALAPGYGLLLVGRIVTGIGVGVSFVVAPVYLSEVAPTNVRGQLNSVFDVAINGGILLGYVVGFCVQLLSLPTAIKWRVMLGLGNIAPILVLVNLASLPESPRWLVMRNQSGKAKQVLRDLGHSPQHVTRTISSIEEEVVSSSRHEETMALATNRNIHENNNGCFSLLQPQKWSYGKQLALALGFWQQVTGTEAVLYYSADFLRNAGLESATQRLLGNVFVGLCKLLPELFAMNVVDRIGRQPLMRASAVSLMLSTATLSLAFYLSWSPVVVVLLLCAIMASFSVGLGPFTFMIASENLGLTERASGVTLCAAINRCTSGTVALTAVSLYESLGSSGFFALYAVVGLCSLPFYFGTLPETSGQSLEELAAARNRRTVEVMSKQSSSLSEQQQQQQQQQQGTSEADERQEPLVENSGEII